MNIADLRVLTISPWSVNLSTSNIIFQAHFVRDFLTHFSANDPLLPFNDLYVRFHKGCKAISILYFLLIIVPYDNLFCDLHNACKFHLRFVLMFPHKYRPFVLTNIFQHSFLDAGRHLWAHSLAALDGLQFLHPILPDFDDGAAMTRSWQFDAVPHPSCGLMQGQLLVYTILKVPPRSGFVLASVSDSSSAFWVADLCGKALSLSLNQISYIF